jgi:A/G-specific adenine glycosylase
LLKELILKKYYILLSKKLLHWHKNINKRELPWKQETDPYKIWLSEILLQQTRAEAVIPYYQKFVAHFPTITHLAIASEQLVFQLWQGLGYYNRCRNLLATAKYISKECMGIFPNGYNKILALKGVGPYTASAIASFGFGLPHAVVDGNVYRILARLLAIDTPIDSTAGKHFFQQQATALLAKRKPALYNQAIMDLGATICKPKQPLCPQCPWQADCKAWATDTVDLYPVKSKKTPVKIRHFHYLVFDDGAHLYIKKRIEKDVWQDLHEFVLQESSDKQLPKIENMNIVESPAIHTQLLTHQRIYGYFYTIYNAASTKMIKEYGLQKIDYQSLPNFAWPKMIHSFLLQNGYLSD